MKLRWAGDDKLMRGTTAIECLRYHCHPAYAALPTLEARCDAFVKAALQQGWLVDVNTEAR